MERNLNIPNIISAKDAAMLAAYGDDAQKVLIDIFNNIKEAVKQNQKSVSIPIKGHSTWALKKYLTTFGYSVEPRFKDSFDKSIIIISWS